MRLSGCGAGNGACHPRGGHDVEFAHGITRQRQPRLDPSEMVFMALNTGFSGDMGVMAMMLEGSREARKDEAQGEVR